MISLSSFAINLVDHLGLLGIGIGVGLNGFGIPGISEVMLPVAGVSIHQGHLSPIPVFVSAMIGQMIGLLGAYCIARYGGIELVERYGKYVLISRRELDATEKLFGRWGGWLIMFGGIIPGVQGFIGYAGGIARMNLVRFLIFAAIGKTVWIAGLLYLGYLLGSKVSLIDTIISRFGMVIIVLAVAAIVIWYSRQRRPRRTTAGEGSRKNGRQEP